MALLGQIGRAVESFNRDVEEKTRRVTSDRKWREQVLHDWEKIRNQNGAVTTPTGLTLPRVALPAADDPAQVAHYLYGEGLPGEFPFMNAVYPQMYQSSGNGHDHEEPTRLFAGLGLAEDTNRRFHYLTRQQRSQRLSTAFDGPTLYGMDSDADGVFGKIGEGGVAIDTLDDMKRLYAGFPLDAENVSVSMTINGPAPILLAMYVAAAIKRLGPEVLPRLRGTVQADVFKEVQAQNEMIFPTEAALRFLGDMVEFTTERMPRWYPISISGYHIAEAGATPVQQAAFTLSNGFTYAEIFRDRGIPLQKFGPRLSFFLDCGLDVEYLVLARVCRKIWAIGMRDVFGADAKSQRFKLHTQTSGRSLVAAGFRNNLTRTAIELMLAYINATNSCHSNSADEPFTTPQEQYVRLAAQAQAIVLEESGLFKHTTNLLTGSPGMRAVEEAVEKAILAEFDAIDRLGGVLPAMESRYQRSQIQAAALRYERQIADGTRPIIGLNRYRASDDPEQIPAPVRTPLAKKRRQIERLKRFKRKHARQAPKALDDLTRVVETGGNVFAELVRTVEHCSLGQITARLWDVVGPYRPTQ
jgi:methylmalonyl-CoA mutase